MRNAQSTQRPASSCTCHPRKGCLCRRSTRRLARCRRHRHSACFPRGSRSSWPSVRRVPLLARARRATGAGERATKRRRVQAAQVPVSRTRDCPLAPCLLSRSTGVLSRRRRPSRHRGDTVTVSRRSRSGWLLADCGTWHKSLASCAGEIDPAITAFLLSVPNDQMDAP